jgi:hypothetical protein
MKTKILLAACAAITLASCSSVVSPDGTKSTKPDKAAISSAFGFGRYILDRLAPAPAPVNIKPGK